MYFYAARQPILNRDKKLFAYELLFQDSIDNIFPDANSDEATSKMVEASQFNMGISNFTGNKAAFIHFTLETLSQGYPTMLANEEVIIEVIETNKPGKKLLAICKNLYEQGYTIALGNYEHKTVWAHFYPYVKIIKIDVQQNEQAEIKEIQAAINNFPHIKLLAENVETHEKYDQAFALGFEYFQGFYLSKPEMVKRKDLSPSQLAMAELLYQTSKTELDLAAITSVFQHDVSLSYKLLRYANSPIFRRRNEIATIKQALVILGLNELKRFIGLMFATTANPDKPSELIKLAMARAKFCELAAQQITPPIDDSSAFLTGLLSMIDAILDEKIASILEKLPLAQEIKDTLLTHKGVMAALIKLVELIEHADWDKMAFVMDKLALEKDQVMKCYNEALAWTDEQDQLT